MKKVLSLVLALAMLLGIVPALAEASSALPHVGDVIMQGAEHLHAFDSPVLMTRRKVIQPGYRTIKRIFDFTVSLIGIIVLSIV